MGNRLVRGGVAVALAAGIVLAGTLPAQAVTPPPGQELEIIYYSNASYTDAVGVRWAGPCQEQDWGKTTKYFRGSSTTC
jgi:hypothetical protein